MIVKRPLVTYGCGASCLAFPNIASFSWCVGSRLANEGQANGYYFTACGQYSLRGLSH